VLIVEHGLLYWLFIPFLSFNPNINPFQDYRIFTNMHQNQLYWPSMPEHTRNVLLV